jgi:hypothetical protein
MKAPRIGFLDPGRDYVRVKVGFSWPAFFFGAMWASAKKLWGALFLMLLVEIGLYALGAAAQAQRSMSLALVQLAIQLAYALARGFFGNAWWRASLRRRGYQVYVEKRDAVT